jgi:hypothetical protein
MPELDLRPGAMIEWIVGGPGSGAMTASLAILSRWLERPGTWVILDPDRESYIPALSGWSVNTNRTLLIRPTTLKETCWAIEQCLRCPGVSVTWAFIEKPVPISVRRRWKMAVDVGGGVGLLFRTDEAEHEPVWADLRLRATPLAGGRGDSRQIKIDVLYRRGGIGGSAQVWEIDHAAGDVRVVPEVANPKAAKRAARA